MRLDREELELLRCVCMDALEHSYKVLRAPGCADDDVYFHLAYINRNRKMVDKLNVELEYTPEQWDAVKVVFPKK